MRKLRAARACKHGGEAPSPNIQAPEKRQTSSEPIVTRCLGLRAGDPGVLCRDMSQKPEEWFDVVNERDEVIGRELRRNVHARGLWHRAVHVLVFDRAGRVFLQKRSMLKDLSPGLWDSSCSGHLDSGED